MAKRTGEAGAGLVAATKAAALKNWMADQEAHRGRVANAEQAGWKALGMDIASAGQQQGVSRGGDIVVTGDVYGDSAVSALASRAIALESLARLERQQDLQQVQSLPQSQAQTVQKSGVSSMLAGALLSAVLLTGGAGIGLGVPWMMGAFEDKPASAASSDDTDTATTIEALQIYEPSEASADE